MTDRSDHSAAILEALKNYLVTDNHIRLDSFSLEQLRAADEDFGPDDVDASTRIALRYNIEHREETDSLMHTAVTKEDLLLEATQSIAASLITLIDYAAYMTDEDKPPTRDTYD